MSVTTVAGSFITVNTIDSDHYIDGSIDLAHIGANQIDGTKLAIASQAAGDVMYYNGTDWIRLAKGTADQVLTMNDGATAPNWEAASAGATLSGSTNNTIVTVTGSDAMIGEANLTFDGTDLTVGTGNVVIGTAGKGIDFSAQANPAGGMTSELLDHYEEGTWTPTLEDQSQSPSESQTAMGDKGLYVKIVKMVSVIFEIQQTSLGSLTTSEAAYIGGLPFVNNNSSEGGGAITVGGELAITAGSSISWHVIAASDTAVLESWDVAYGDSSLLVSEFSSNGIVRGTGVYYI